MTTPSSAPISPPVTTQVPSPVRHVHANVPGGAGGAGGAVWTQAPVSPILVKPSVATSTPVETSTTKSTTLAPSAKEQLKTGPGSVANIAAATGPISRAQNIGEWSLWTSMLSILVISVLVVI